MHSRITIPTAIATIIHGSIVDEESFIGEATGVGVSTLLLSSLVSHFSVHLPTQPTLVAVQSALHESSSAEHVFKQDG